MNDYDLISPSGFEYAVATETEYRREFSLDIERLIGEQFKGKIRIDTETLGFESNHLSGSIMYNAKEGMFTIAYNPSHTETRQRFTLAHELGHYFLHKDILTSGTTITDNTMYRGSISDRYEVQANRFAASVLMPYSLIERYKRGYSGRSIGVRQIAEAFGVSDVAMSIRLGIPC